MALRCRGSITIYPRTGVQKCKMSRIKTQNTKNGAVFLLLFIFFPTETDAHRRSHHYTCNTIYGLKKRLCSLAIKARDSPCTQGGKRKKNWKTKGKKAKTKRGDEELNRKSLEEQRRKTQHTEEEKQGSLKEKPRKNSS
jgi:hypothetical protein